MDNILPSNEIPHPEWVGWSSDKQECMTDGTAQESEQIQPIVVAPASTTVKSPISLKYILIIAFLLVVIVLIYLYGKKWWAMTKTNNSAVDTIKSLFRKLA